MFFRASASERALILHNLLETPLKASARIPAARAARAIETLEMAAFAADIENFTLELGEALILPCAGSGAGGQRSRRRAAGLCRQGAGHAEPGFSAGAAVPQSRIRLLGARTSTGCRGCTTDLQRAIRPDHAGRVARLDHGGHPRQVPPRALRRRTPSRALGARPNSAGGATARRRTHRLECSGASHRSQDRSAERSAERFSTSQIEKMPPCPVLGLDDPGIRVEPDFLDETLFH